MSENNKYILILPDKIFFQLTISFSCYLGDQIKKM